MTWVLQPYDWKGREMRSQRFGDRKAAERVGDRLIADREVQSIYVTERDETGRQVRGNGRYR